MASEEEELRQLHAMLGGEARLSSGVFTRYLTAEANRQLADELHLSKRCWKDQRMRNEARRLEAVRAVRESCLEARERVAMVRQCLSHSHIQHSREGRQQQRQREHAKKCEEKAQMEAARGRARESNAVEAGKVLRMELSSERRRVGLADKMRLEEALREKQAADQRAAKEKAARVRESRRSRDREGEQGSEFNSQSGVDHRGSASRRGEISSSQIGSALSAQGRREGLWSESFDLARLQQRRREEAREERIAQLHEMSISARVNSSRAREQLQRERHSQAADTRARSERREHRVSRRAELGKLQQRRDEIYHSHYASAEQAAAFASSELWRLYSNNPQAGREISRANEELYQRITWMHAPTNEGVGGGGVSARLVCGEDSYGVEELRSYGDAYTAGETASEWYAVSRAQSSPLLQRDRRLARTDDRPGSPEDEKLERLDVLERLALIDSIDDDAVETMLSYRVDGQPIGRRVV